LTEIANEGHGSYSFIPCPGFIGTIFVNGIANAISTLASNTELEIEMLNGVKVKKVLGNMPFLYNKIKVGDVQYG